MTKTTFSVVRFSPRPEEVERVSVAVILDADGTRRLIVDESFARLQCVAGDYDTTALRQHLDDIVASRTSLTTLHEKKRGQFEVLRPKAVLVERPLDELAAWLQSRFLSAAITRTRAARSHQRNRVLQVLDRGLAGAELPGDVEVMKRVHVDSFLPERTLKKFGANGVAISRVLRSPAGCWVIDGLDGASTQDTFIRRASDLDYIFKKLNDVKADFQQEEGMPLHTLFVVVDAERIESDERRAFHAQRIREEVDEELAPGDIQRVLRSVVAPLLPDDDR